LPCLYYYPAVAVISLLPISVHDMGSHNTGEVSQMVNRWRILHCLVSGHAVCS